MARISPTRQHETLSQLPCLSQPSRPSRDRKWDRRSFVRALSATAGAFVLSSRAKPRQSTLSAAVLGANERIRIGVVGVGGMGTGHVSSLVQKSAAENIAVVAVSDVYQRRLRRAQGICQGDGYLDYRELLDRTDIDAVLIATPDHWHAKISIDALEAGKHVYCEKPLTHTIEQAIQVRNTARKKTNLVFQVGPNGTADDGYWKGNKAITEGRIGKVTWAHASYNRNARICLFNEHQKIDPTAGPDKAGDDFIDWNRWLGHEWGLAPKIPWNAEHFFRFRKYWPYNGGVATDLLYHKLAPLLIAISGPSGEYPLRVNANGGLYVEKDGRDIPDTFLMTADYPSDWSLFLASTLTNDAGIPDRVYGKFGTMDLGGEPLLRKNGDFEQEFRGANQGQDELRIPIEPRRDLENNWIDAMRGSGPVLCNVELGCATMVAIKMAVESFRQHKTMLWDAEKEEMSPA